MECGKKLENRIYDFCKVDSKHFGPAENSALARIIEMNSVEPKDNFFDYYKEDESGKSSI